MVSNFNVPGGMFGNYDHSWQGSEEQGNHLVVGYKYFNLGIITYAFKALGQRANGTFKNCETAEVRIKNTMTTKVTNKYTKLSEYTHQILEHVVALYDFEIGIGSSIRVDTRGQTTPA